jgi:hypothetical protein
VSGVTIDCATKVLAEAVPERVKAVDDGRVTVSRAAKLTDEPLAAHDELRRRRPVSAAAPDAPLNEREVHLGDPSERVGAVGHLVAVVAQRLGLVVVMGLTRGDAGLVPRGHGLLLPQPTKSSSRSMRRRSSRASRLASR